MTLLWRFDQQHSQRAVLASAIGPGNTETPIDTGLDPTLGAPLPDPTHSMLRAAPESAAQRFVKAAQQQLQQRRLISPAGDNAYDSVMTAWRTDPSHTGLAAVNARLLSALADDSVQRLREGEDAVVRDAIGRMERLAERDRARGSATMAEVRKRLGTTLVARMDRARAKADRAGAQRIVASAKSLGLDGAQVAALQTQATKIAKPGDQLADNVGNMTLIEADGKVVAVSRASITRGDYAEFSKATKRQPALCRERASLLRVLAPRTWDAPGFDQANNAAVVCVSWQDAEAYARWQSQRGKYRYRLPTAAEAQAASRSDSGKAVAEWLNDCAGGGCARRMTAGRSWRGAGGGRPLEAQRGYDDVGFRLVREM